MRKTFSGTLFWYLGIFVFFSFLLLPLVILIAVSFNPTSMVFPPQGFTLKWYFVILEKGDFLTAAAASTILGLATAFITTSLGVLAAIGLQRFTGAFKDIITTFLISPLFIPAVIVALALFQIIFTIGVVNNIQILLAAHIVVTMPYPVRNVMAQMENFDIRLEEAALSVGATHRQALWRVTIPLLKPSIIPSLIIVFVLSWNNYTVSVFLANKDWTTLPLQLRAYLQYEYEPFVAAISTLLILISMILLVVLDRTVGLGHVKR